MDFSPSGSMEFSRQEYQSGLPFPSPGDLPHPGIKPGSPALQEVSLLSESPGKPIYISSILFRLRLWVAILCLVAQSCPTFCDPMNGSPPGSFVQGDSPGKNTGVGCHAFLQGIFPTQELNQDLLPCRWILTSWVIREALILVYPELFVLDIICWLPIIW